VAAACCADLAVAAGGCGMVAGQVADLEAEIKAGNSKGADETSATSKTPSSEAVESGTSKLSQLEAIHRRKTGRLLCSAVTMGARIAQTDQSSLNRLEQFGNRVGLAFQIADDLLDVTGDASKLGKGVRKDASLGKMTYPSLLGIEESRRCADCLIDEACQLLEPFGSKAESLKALANFVTHRDH